MSLPHVLRSGAVLIICTFLMPVMMRPAAAFGQSGSTPHAQQRTAGHGHAVDLKWKASASRVVGYYVYRSEMRYGPFMKLNSIPLRATRYSDGSVHAGLTYFYKVTSVDNKERESLFSNQIKAVVPSP